jgi:hypothetical protein
MIKHIKTSIYLYNHQNNNQFIIYKLVLFFLQIDKSYLQKHSIYLV